MFPPPATDNPTDAATPDDPLAGLAAPLRAALWQADRLAELATPVQPSGHAALDAALPGGGWPCGMLTELLWPAPGAGEWRLLAPALAALGQAGREVLCIAPPHRPYAPALAALGLDLAHLLVLQDAAAPLLPADAAWAAEQALKSRACGAVLWWVAPAQTGTRCDLLRPDMARRLHLAAQGSEALLFVMRPLAAQRESSPAPLRLACTPAAEAGHLQVDLFKRRGPRLERPIVLDLAAALPEPLRWALQRHRRRLQEAPAAPTSLPAKEPADVVAGRAPAAAADRRPRSLA